MAYLAPALFLLAAALVAAPVAAPAAAHEKAPVAISVAITRADCARLVAHVPDPDVAYRPPNGMAWIELKYVPHWPVRDTTPLTLGLTLEQQAHLRDWCEDGRGHGFVIVLVEANVYVFPWHVANVVERGNIATTALLCLHLKDVKNLLGRQLDELILPSPGAPMKDAVWIDLGKKVPS